MVAYAVIPLGVVMPDAGASGSSVEPDDADVRASGAVAFAESQVPELLSPRRTAALDRMEAAYSDLVAALDWLIERGDLDRVARLIRALRSYWPQIGGTER